jgi:hypothetical protein
MNNPVKRKDCKNANSPGARRFAFGRSGAGKGFVKI